MTAIEISSEYAWVVLVSAIIGLQVILQGFAIGGQRKTHFSKQYLDQHFKKFNPAQGGYPDMGNGKYTQHWSVEQWVEFNNYQRVHYNYVEGVATILILVTGSGIFCPRLSVVFGLLYIFGRAVYALGYRSQGAKGRLIGALLIDISLLVLLIFTIYSAFKFGGGVDGLIKLFRGVEADVKEFVAPYLN